MLGNKHLQQPVQESLTAFRRQDSPGCSLDQSLALRLRQGRLDAGQWQTRLPLEKRRITANIFTAPEIATVGWGVADIDAGRIREIWRDCLENMLASQAGRGGER